MKQVGTIRLARWHWSWLRIRAYCTCSQHKIWHMAIEEGMKIQEKGFLIAFGLLRVGAYCFCSSAESSDIRWPSAVILCGNFNIGWCDLSRWSDSPSGLLFCAVDDSLDWLSFLDSLLGSVLAGSSCLVSSDEDWVLPESDAEKLNYAHHIREQTESHDITCSIWRRKKDGHRQLNIEAATLGR